MENLIVALSVHIIHCFLVLNIVSTPSILFST